MKRPKFLKSGIKSKKKFFPYYRRSSDSADSISAVPGLVRIANRTILPKFPDLVRIANHSQAGRNLKIPILGERDQIIEEVVNLGSDLDFELNTQNVKQCLQFDERHMSSEDLFEINQPRAFEHEELEDIPENPAEMS